MQYQQLPMLFIFQLQMLIVLSVTLLQVESLMEPVSHIPAVSATRILASLGAAVAGVAVIAGIYLSVKK